MQPHCETSCLNGRDERKRHIGSSLNRPKWLPLSPALAIKLRHLKAAWALHFAHYNFCRIHSATSTVTTKPLLRSTTRMGRCALPIRLLPKVQVVWQRIDD
jgi:hypothetical protein